MCGALFGGGGSSTPAPQRIDPAPTTVQASDVQADSGSGDKERREQERRKRAATAISTDRDTILGSTVGGRNTMG